VSDSMTKETKFTSFEAYRREAVERFGHEEVERRLAIAEQHAHKIAEDPSFFSQDSDRDMVFMFMGHRLRQLALALSEKNFKKFEKSYDTAGCIILKLIEKGKMI